jgi:Leucine-rich repeat (LRR) protein
LEGLENIDFDQNMGIQGTIPTSLGTLDSLKNLDLNTNDLMGPLPAELCDATMLERIDVLSNSLEGMISNCIGELESLDVLSLDINMFSGTLPTTVGQMSSLRKSLFLSLIILYCLSCTYSHTHAFFRRVSDIEQQ